MILFCSISSSVFNGNVDCAGDGDVGSFIKSSLTCSNLSCKIRFEAPKRQRESERKIAKMRSYFDYISTEY
jgi:hypothetical protein